VLFVDSKGCRFYVGVCYQTPSINVYSTGNHDLLREVIGVVQINVLSLWET